MNREVELSSRAVRWTVVCFSYSQQLVLWTVFLTLFPSTVERASCRAHELLYTGEFPTTLISNVLVLVLFPVFATRIAWGELFLGTDPPPPPPPPPHHALTPQTPLPRHLIYRMRFLWTLIPNSQLDMHTCI